MGLFGFDSNKTDASQNYTDKRVAGTDQALVLAAQDKSNVVGPGSIQLQKGGTVNQTDASVTQITTADPGVLRAALRNYTELADNLTQAARFDHCAPWP